MKLALDKLVGRGGFSRVYLARVTSSSSAIGTEVAVKKMHITKHVQNSVLRHEACAYILLAGSGHSSVPEVYAWGRSQYYDYLALELLGDDVLSVREGLTLRNFVILACAMLDALEHVHSRGIVHCDVKPGNFLFSRAPPKYQLKLIDFGLAIPFRDLSTGEHVLTSERSTGHLRGTELYASIPAHMHCTLARRDDMESLAYTLVHLACGRLPWAHPSVYGVNILHRKVAWRADSEAAQLPPVLAQFVSYTRALGFDAEPEYALWRAAFRALVPDLRSDDVFDPADEGLRVIDWAPPPQPQPQIQIQILQNQPPSSDSDSDSIPSSDDGWVPTSVWPAPVSVPLSHLFGNGDEQAVVRDSEQVEWIEEPPEMGKAWLVQSDCPERMMEF
ncbi:kinase-like protein [Exidia glandulosa HHB12029]|uniref:non-specific serine/threonine protein kinase n=1 Tax=Exidia glandulosa HHB12029 TaxID=1314781 RepID=A0A165G005_EXIGL|nr:kinase-like protein [Exidia glandulosa HHB12029]